MVAAKRFNPLTGCALCRLSTAGLLIVLSILNRQWFFCLLVLLMLDIFSHWFQMYATLAAGAATHKVGQPVSMKLGRDVI